MSLGIRTTVGPTVLLLTVLAAAAGCGGDEGDTTATDSSDESSTSAGVDPSVSASTSVAPSGEASPSLPSTTDATEEVVLPACSSVWVVGQQLPGGYQGCTDGGEVVQADGLYCEFGKPIFTYAKNFYAVENGPVNQTETTLRKDRAYQQAVRKCGG